MATEAQAAGEAAEAVGMPQLDFSTYPNQIFWLVVAMVVLYLLLSRQALPRIAGILTERRSTIEADLAQAEELKRRAGEAEEAYQKALADARTEAQRIIAESRAEMQSDLDAATEQAEARIAEKMKESEARIAEIRESAVAVAAEVAHDISGALVTALGQEAEADEIRAAVDARLEGSAS